MLFNPFTEAWKLPNILSPHKKLGELRTSPAETQEKLKCYQTICASPVPKQLLGFSLLSQQKLEHFVCFFGILIFENKSNSNLLLSWEHIPGYFTSQLRVPPLFFFFGSIHKCLDNHFLSTPLPPRAFPGNKTHPQEDPLALRQFLPCCYSPGKGQHIPSTHLIKALLIKHADQLINGDAMGWWQWQEAPRGAGGCCHLLSPSCCFLR